MTFDDATLQDDIKALQQKLGEGKEESKDEKTIAKTLADVAQGAIALAREKSEEKPLRKAAKMDDEEEDMPENDDDEEDGDEEDGDDNDDVEAFVQKLMKENAAMRKSLDHTSRTKGHGRTTGLRKAFDPAREQTPVDVSSYLQEEIAIREGMAKKMGALLKSLAAMQNRMDAIEKNIAKNDGAIAKGIMTILEKQDKIMQEIDAPVSAKNPDSRFELMAKTMQNAGGTTTPFDEQKGFKLVQSGKITTAQMAMWQRTNILPPGVTA